MTYTDALPLNVCIINKFKSDDDLLRESPYLDIVFPVSFFSRLKLVTPSSSQHSSAMHLETYANLASVAPSRASSTTQPHCSAGSTDRIRQFTIAESVTIHSCLLFHSVCRFSLLVCTWPPKND